MPFHLTVRYLLSYRLWALLLLLVAAAPLLTAQADEIPANYRPLLTAAETMLESKRYAQAVAQAEAAYRAGEEARLPLLQAAADQVRGLAYVRDPQAEALERVTGIKALRRAALTYQQLGREEEVATVLGQISAETGRKEELPRLRDARP
ncbi:MAG: hypothetical protein WBA17_06900, partial [Saprospiraceae bacterium]